MNQHIHIIGIGGTFMGSLAALAKSCGYKVTGCDSKIYPPMSTQLENLAIDVIEGFAANQINLNPDLYIIGNVAKREMPIIEAILNQNKPYISGPQWLYENILHKYHVIAVAGTHGKTSTASMLAWILEYAGNHAGFLIGGIPENFKLSARLPQQSAYFVIEADEYDTAFFDKRSKFIHYHPKTLVINNLEYDHADIFENLAAIQKQFHHLIKTVPSEGQIIYNGSAKSITEVLQMGCWTATEPFGIKDGFNSIALDNGTDFTVLDKTNVIGTVHWNLMGHHNQLNALAAITAAKHLGIDYPISCQALTSFANVKRRMEVKGIVNQITVYDDFAHHPAEIKTTIAGLRNKIGQQHRIIAILEPRSNTMKLGSMKSLLADALNDSNQIFCYAGNIDWDIEQSLANIAAKTKIETDFNQLIQDIVAFAKPQDHILIMSNGSFNGIHQKLLTNLAINNGN